MSGLSAYQEIEKTTLSGRALEALILNKAAMQLIDARNNWTTATDGDGLDEALKYNQKIWTFFQVELTDPENALPVEIKQNLLSLARFVDKRTVEVMVAPTPEKLDILIAINQNIAAGLNS
jgi:flagellar biosynthesis activator protein FlaF